MFDISAQLDAIVPTALVGSVARTVGMTAAVADFPAPIGALASIERQAGGPVAAEVIGFRDDLTLLYMYEETHGIRRGNRVRLVRSARWIKVGDALLGAWSMPGAKASMAGPGRCSPIARRSIGARRRPSSDRGSKSRLPRECARSMAL